MIGLTRVQKRALDFIRGYLLEHGFAPSFEEIAAGIGATSKGHVHQLVAALADRGAITYQPGRARSIAVVARGGFTIELPADLDTQVRVLADSADTTPEAVIVECVRDRLTGGTFRSPFVTRETVQHGNSSTISKGKAA